MFTGLIRQAGRRHEFCRNRVTCLSANRDNEQQEPGAADGRRIDRYRGDGGMIDLRIERYDFSDKSARADAGFTF